MICFFGCDMEEERAFQAACQYQSLDALFFRCALNEENAKLVPHKAVVSVSHRTIVAKPEIRALHNRCVSYINTRSVGTDHIDTDFATSLGILVEGVPYSPESIAEHAVMLMLMMLRNAIPTIKRIENGDYRLAESRGDTLFGKTVGIIGTGRIGQCVARLLKGFGCRLIAYDPSPMAQVEYMPLDSLLRQSDIVTLHLPLTGATRHLIGQKRLSLMKNGAILINAARGALVDTVALTDALARGKLGGAGLDVAENEYGWLYHDRRGMQGAPFEELTSLPNVVFSAHSAFYTRTALADIVALTLENCTNHGRSVEKWIV